VVYGEKKLTCSFSGSRTGVSPLNEDEQSVTGVHTLNQHKHADYLQETRKSALDRKHIKGTRRKCKSRVSINKLENR
jgi:hypothetical protein